ncbi:MAG TPA: potassium transporter Kup [Longimicrobiales bacterium]
MTHSSSAAGAGRTRVAALTLGAIGIVYGDIGTSPIYAFRESFHEHYGLETIEPNILGVLSCIFWALIIIVTIKYVIFMMRADNEGEGGILALTALLTPMRAGMQGKGWILIAIGLFGAALLYGDAIITPAVSVLSAVEGLRVATPFFNPYIVPIAVAILIALFLIQRTGTHRVGRLFGPVMLVWFTVLALLGIVHIVQEPHVLLAVSPVYAWHFFAENGAAGWLVLGSVFLVVTGGEALYADMGHFGASPIRLAWYFVVLPALLLNYFGQGALLIQHPEFVENPFFHMAPGWFLYPQVVLSTMAAVIASQAVISGSFSLARQSVQLGYSPRLKIEHTSEAAMGQIYVPAVNWMLMVACIALVLGFGSSSNLAAAYGVAVTTTMVITTILFYVLVRRRWHWSRWVAVPVAGFLLVITGAFWSASMVKVPQGGWVPLVIGAAIYTLMTTWRTGREVLSERIGRRALPLTDFVDSIIDNPPHRVPGTAVFMFRDADATPPALLHNLKHNKILHEHVVFLSVHTEETPHVPEATRTVVEPLGGGLHSVLLRYGFMEDVDVPRALAGLNGQYDLDLRPMSTTYFLGREKLIASKKNRGMALWRERLFALMSRNARSATDFFRLPPNRVVELGAQVEL